MSPTHRIRERAEDGTSYTIITCYPNVRGAILEKYIIIIYYNYLLICVSILDSVRVFLETVGSSFEDKC